MPARKPHVGDLALHKSNTLDARPVSKVSDDGTQVWLQFSTQDFGPFDACNYRYSKPVQIVHVDETQEIAGDRR